AMQLVGSAEFQDTLSRLRKSELVDYAAVATAKLRVLELLYAHFRAKHLIPGSERGHAFRGYCVRGGEALHLHGLFEAIQEHYFAEDAAIRGWPEWPESFHDPRSPAADTRSFAPCCLRAIHRHLARQHALRPSAAHRSCHGADAPVLDSRRQRRRCGSLCAVSVCGSAWHSRFGESTPPVSDHRRGPRHRSGGDSHRTRYRGRALLPPALFRARRCG